jgi:S-adenosylmethionine:tRNA ribosyltransferase-isomerase
MRDLPALIEPGDLLVFNDTRVMPARLFGRKETGGRVEILIERLLGRNEARAQLGVSKSPSPAARIALDDGTRRPSKCSGAMASFYLLRFHVRRTAGKAPAAQRSTATAALHPARSGRGRRRALPDRVRARIGAVAAPTAGLHFDDALLAACANAACEFGHGHAACRRRHLPADAGRDIRDHRMHSEWLNVGAELVRAGAPRTRAAGGRVIAVGTTVVRALEASWHDGRTAAVRRAKPTLFIFPGVASAASTRC